MEELLWMRMSGGMGSGLDVSALIAFLAFAAAYFLAPMAGYDERRPGGLTLALYLMIAYAGVSVIQLALQWVQLLDGGRGGIGGGGMLNPNRGGFGEFTVHILFLFMFVKLVIFIIAMIAFVNGLRGLRPRQYEREE